ANGRFPHEEWVMDNQVNVVGARPSAAERPQESGAAALGRGGRMSRQRKTAAVLRLLRGEDLESVSRELGVTAATLTGWHDAFLAAGEAALTTRATTGEELESDRLKARLGAGLIGRDPLNRKIAPAGGGDGARAVREAKGAAVGGPPPFRPAEAKSQEPRHFAGHRQAVWSGCG